MDDILEVPFEITSGLPFSKSFAVTLPTDRDWWTDIDQFEVLSQIREKKEREAPLVLDLSARLAVTMPTADLVVVDLVMTGAHTRELLKSGYYDVIMSDTGTGDSRGFKISRGPVKRRTVVTAEEVDAP